MGAANADVETKTKAVSEAAATFGAATDAPVTIAEPQSLYVRGSIMGDSAYLEALQARNDAPDAAITAGALLVATKDTLQNALAKPSKQPPECKLNVLSRGQWRRSGSSSKLVMLS